MPVMLSAPRCSPQSEAAAGCGDGPGHVGHVHVRAPERLITPVIGWLVK